MTDEITAKHLNRLRVRGAPKTIPGIKGLINKYEVEETRKHAVRALAVPLEADFGPEEIREAKKRLAQAAASQGARPTEEALIALHGDPAERTPSEWTYRMVLPIRGPAKADEENNLFIERIHGGTYIETMTTKGLPDLRSLYTYFVGSFLPSRKQQLTLPIIYHRVIDGLEQDEPDKLTIQVFIPIQLSIKPPPKVVTREHM